MALDSATLAAKLREFMDAEYAGFVGWPADELDAAAKWAAAIDAYAGANVVPLPVDPAPATARASLEIGLAGMSAAGAGPGIFDTAFVSYATALAVGMQTTVGGSFVVAPPPAGTLSVSLAAQAALALPPNQGIAPATQLASIASVIDAWFRTGTVTPSGGGTPTPWS